MRITFGLTDFQLYVCCVPRLYAPQRNRMRIQLRRGHNSKNQLPIISFYNTRHFSLTFDSCALYILLFSFSFFFAYQAGLAFGPVEIHFHLSQGDIKASPSQSQRWNLVKTEMCRSRNVIVGGHGTKLDVEKLCCPRSCPCPWGCSSYPVTASFIFWFCTRIPIQQMFSITQWTIRATALLLGTRFSHL